MRLMIATITVSDPASESDLTSQTYLDGKLTMITQLKHTAQLLENGADITECNLEVVFSSPHSVITRMFDAGSKV